MPITGARVYVEAPAVSPTLGGLLSVARVVPFGDGHEALGAEYETDACGVADLWSDNCDTEYAMTPCNPTGSPSLITMDGLSLVTGDPITVVAGIECGDLIGSGGLARMRQRAERALALKEPRAIEVHVQTLLAATVTDLTPGGGAHIGAGIGLLEEWLGNNYAGLGLIHMGRYAATCAMDRSALMDDGNPILHTRQGTPVANGTGYSGLTIYATGQVMLRRGPVLSFDAPPMSQFTVDTTDYCPPPRATAQRTYVPLIECGIAKVTVTC